MPGRHSSLSRTRPTPARAGLALAGLLVAASLAGRVSAQAPPPPPPADPAPALAGPADAGERPDARIFEVKIGQGRFLALPEPIDAPPQKVAPFAAVGDPSVADFFQVTSDRFRILGKKLGATDLSFATASGKTYEYEIRVVADLDVLRDQLRQIFPEASLRLTQFRDKIVVEGQARDAIQVGRIVDVIETYVRSVQRVQLSGQVGDIRNQIMAASDPNAAADPNAPNGVAGALAAGAGAGAPLPPGALPGDSGSTAAAGLAVPMTASGGGAAQTNAAANVTLGKIATNLSPVINLIRVPTSQQVLLKVRVAELNRTGYRQIGADLLATIPQFGTLFGTQIAGNGLGAGAVGDRTFTSGVAGISGQVGNPRSLSLGPAATAYGTFSRGQFNAVLTALRRNNLLKILAEPNLVALNGHQANFLAGGEFPVPSFSGVGSGAPGGGGTSSTQFKKFGVSLSFLPIILDNETIRLTVDPEVSSVDFSVATTLVPGGSPVPGLNVRNSHTTVELRQGETLAIAGLMQLSLDGSTQRIPGLGDLPYIGEFFSNTTSNRVEKELVVLVTPYLVEPMAPNQVPPGPGDEVNQPNDLEFFFLNRIEGRTGVDQRSTTSYDDPLHLIRHSLVERKYLVGPSGFSK